ncbi:MAG: mercury resistance protein [Candidatus Rokubacteria bacterium]|nr:mercury resistance protein [Candidatus Rokubacteria bacterium]
MTTPAEPGPDQAPPASLKGYVLLGLAVVTCPCHLPILLLVLAGTGLAGALSQYFGLAFLTLSVIFIVSLVFGLKALKGGEHRRT